MRCEEVRRRLGSQERASLVVHVSEIQVQLYMSVRESLRVCARAVRACKTAVD